MMCVPYRQHLWDYAGTGLFYIHARKDFVIRTDGVDPTALANAVRQVVADVDTSVAVDNMIPMRQRLREGFIVTVAGLVIGIGGAFGLTRLIANQLYGVAPMDPLTIASVALLLTTVAMLACVIPARHAAKVNPLRALRTE